MSECCGHLEQAARDPRVPIVRNTESGAFTLRLSDSVSVPNIFCTFCGGLGFEGRKTARRYCKCDRLDRWSKSPSIPIRFDPQLNEFLLAFDNGRIEEIFYFCPACGGRLPESKRGELFTTPSEDEIERLHALLRGSNSIAEVVSILGAPSRRMGPMPTSTVDKEVYGYKDIKQTLVYDHLSDTTCLVITESADGSISPIFSGHLRDRQST